MNPRKAASVAALLSLGAVLFAPNAVADTGKGQVRHCVVQAVPLGVDGDPADGPQVLNDAPVCFDSVGAGVAYATGGVASAESAAGVDSPEELAALMKSAEGKSAAFQDVVIGIFYDSNNFGGGTIYTALAASGCTTSLSWGVNYVGDSINDDIASGRSYSSCHHKVFENAGYGGAGAGYYTSAGSYGLVDEEVSSIHFKW
ncbi:hypothetical protein [Lentzea kentuckyensis]|uniref:hypothetical protein n=1 Tax=Lentzea kentuckyensis TaxID=360086 RepID=UPI00117994E9|nr:hypothetical protein [Lentzea kentuckyensis]